MFPATLNSLNLTRNAFHLGRAYKAYEARLFERGIKYPLQQFINATRDPDDEACYRALKRLAIQAHDHENEQKFWAREIRARRHIKDFAMPWKAGLSSSVRYWGGLLYGLLSDFGRSIWRPLAFSALLVFAMYSTHLNAHYQQINTAPPEEISRVKYPASESCDPKPAALQVAIKTSMLGLGFDRTKSDIYKQNYICLYGAAQNSSETPNIPNCIIYLEIMQMLMSAMLIFLTLLGIRNNFKVK